MLLLTTGVLFSYMVIVINLYVCARYFICVVDEKHEKEQNSLILGALNSEQVGTEHHRDEVKEPKMTWAELVSGKKKCTRT